MPSAKALPHGRATGDRPRAAFGLSRLSIGPLRQAIATGLAEFTWRAKHGMARYPKRGIARYQPAAHHARRHCRPYRPRQDRAGPRADRRRDRPPARRAGARHLDRPRLRPLAAGCRQQPIGFVDVPGHERFVRNMLAGVSGADFALLVVAADDGVMPQTIEHLRDSRPAGHCARDRRADQVRPRQAANALPRFARM